MFLDDPKTRKQLTKWAVGTVAACILIFLGIRYVSAIAIAVRWLYDLVEPLLTGTILAMVLNVPLAFLEKHLFRKNPTPKKEKARRPLAILLALVLVLGVFVGPAVLQYGKSLGHFRNGTSRSRISNNSTHNRSPAGEICLSLPF